ncbi:hypothetical protein NUU61_007638 [Penicillium alfredii]|uniref:EamA domain-containing protein n=1 Tax=Penicillium alfredii TaxID=1506179 RepID=A0A9W9EQZ6_9EURO|nr:uncharacterized protein NUU61_007638 [Penicillium alfredii]KAJ5086331.1 hypothetical protein NUU61_007638 [Penicillium alfredii]
MTSPTAGDLPSNRETRIPDPRHKDPDAPLPIEESAGLGNDLDESEPRHIADEEDLEASRPRHAWQARWRGIWVQYKGLVLVTLAQAFAASMNVMTQVLEIHSSMHPFQAGYYSSYQLPGIFYIMRVLFARMSITAVASYFYMWYAHVPAPFGTRPVLGLLLARAVSGFLGVYGLYYSVQYLPLSEATVITFLAPILTCYACSFLIPGETFSRRQQLAGVVSLVGVVLIARPFQKRPSPTAATVLGVVPPPSLPLSLTANAEDSPGAVDSYHHIMATIVAFMGVFGAAGAYTCIRMIGRCAHPLVSVTYFSSATTVISLIAMAAVPSIPFRLPSTSTEWALLTGLGVCGFLLQYLLTAGLAYEPPVEGSRKAGQGSRATAMVYTQMLFAFFYDKVVWGSTLSPVSWAGSALILGCAMYVAVAQEGRPAQDHDDREAYKDDEGECGVH